MKTVLQKPALILAAAGSSTRMGGAVKKEYFPLHTGTVLSEAVRIFLKTLEFSVIAITIPPGKKQETEKALFADPVIKSLLADTALLFVEGGATRQISVFNALTAIQSYAVSIVLIHDGARPFVTADIIRASVDAALKYGAAVPALQPVDTQKEIDADGTIIRHLQRNRIAAVQTPQVFKYRELLEAHRKAAADSCNYTDDTEIWGKYCGPVHVVTGNPCNKKITYPEDLPLPSAPAAGRLLRTGFGYDLHRLSSGRRLMIGGICIPFDKGEDGHSDGDVLLHAVTDAVLGAAAAGDIGSLFPPSDPQWKDADSKKLLLRAWELVRSRGWQLCNLDCVLALEQPRFNPYREAVCTSIASVLSVPSDCVFVKAKTGEKTGAIGHGEAVAAWVSCLLQKN